MSSEVERENVSGVINLKLECFRNYSRLEADFLPQPVALFGHNGAGKTNLLEAISFLSPGRGLRNVKLSQVTQGVVEGKTWAVSSQILTPTQDCVSIGTGLEITPQGGERRIVRVDGTSVTRQSELAEWLSVVWLTPQMGRLFLDSTAQRRKFVDRLVFSLDPAHVEHLQRYDHALTERSSLLKQHVFDSVWLGQLEERMAREAYAITRARSVALQQIMLHQSESFPAFSAVMKGEWETWIEQEEEQAMGRLLKMLHASRSLDSTLGGTRIGPHRSDLGVFHVKQSLPGSQCSTGEQKMLLVSIILAFVRAQTHNRGEERVNLLLLDDVAAHLDSFHREVLFDEICRLKLQVWLTGTDLDVFEELKGRAQFIKVTNSQLFYI